MASKEHQLLSHYLKSIHGQLRQNASTLGGDTAWKMHCEDKETLKKYAITMKELACNHWDPNSAQEHSKVISRVEWIVSYSKEYFLNDLFLQKREKELSILLKIDGTVHTNLDHWKKDKLKLLDVGSCYNPFKKYDLFDVIAIDIAPACEDVIECDFLNDNKMFNEKDRSILQAHSFDIVIFSLFLEYLPTPKQRITSCQKAYELLAPEGILVIVTPDSNHVGINARIMKTWRFLLAEMGFSRIFYEKLPHLHCMVFRKCIDVKIAQRWATLHSNAKFYQELIIPQDLKKNHIELKNNSQDTENSNDFDEKLFEELPFF